METYSFTTVNVIENAVPTAVGNASVSVIGNSVYVFGGTDSKGYCYNDMRSLDITDYLDASDITVAEGSASDYCFKILIIGDACKHIIVYKIDCIFINILYSAVGKSALLTRFAENTFLPNYTCTIGIDFNSRMIRVDKAICKLEIWDTAGQERFSTITANYYRSAQGALLVYDVGSRSSFEHVKNWYDRAKQLGGEDIEPILIGNKNDISSDERVISFEEGQSLAAELAIPFMETSALNGTNVETAFVEMTSRIKKSVDRKGLIGIKGANMKSGAVALADKDRERSLGERCGCN
jgi:small GTP-binding protein